MDIQQVRAARDKLSAELAQPSWLMGIGITKAKNGVFSADGELAVSILVAEITPEIRSQVPTEIDGVKTVFFERSERM